MFKKFKMKTIHSQSVVDLRGYTPKALENIKRIEAVSLLLLPEKPSEEFMEAFSKITCDAVADTLYVSPETQIYSINGIQRISKLSAPEGCICRINGIAIVGNVEENSNVQYFVNGILLIKKGVNIKCVKANGLIFEMDFDEDKVKVFTNCVDIDSSFVRNAETDTLIVASNSIEIAADVTEQELSEKNIRFFAANKVICSKEIKGCIQNRACAGNKIIARK